MPIRPDFKLTGGVGELCNSCVISPSNDWLPKYCVARRDDPFSHNAFCVQINSQVEAHAIAIRMTRSEMTPRNAYLILCSIKQIYDKLADELAASSRMVSITQARAGESGAMLSNGRVTEKWGELR